MLYKTVSLTLAIFFALVLTFYLVILRPTVGLVHLRKQIAEHHLNLKQNRLYLTALAKVDPNTPDLAIELDRVIINIDESNKKALDDLEKRPLSDKDLTKINRLTHLEHADFPDRTKTVLEQQQTIINQLRELDQRLDKIFRYDPLIALETGNPTPSEKKQRLTAAIEGLESIKKDIADLETATSLAAGVTATQESLQELIKILDTTNSSANQAYTTQLTAVVAQFSILRKLALDMEVAVLKTPQAVDLLVEQTNLILEYGNIIDKVTYRIRKRL